MDQHVQVLCRLSYKEETPTTLYKDNGICIGGEYISSEAFLHT